MLWGRSTGLGFSIWKFSMGSRGICEPLFKGTSREKEQWWGRSCANTQSSVELLCEKEKTLQRPEFCERHYHVRELRSSQMMLLVLLIWKLVENRCKSLDDIAIMLVGSQHKPKRLRYIVPLGCFPFSFLSLLLMLCLSITFTVPCHFVLPPTPGDILSL